MSIDLRWLARRDKDLPVPTLVFETMGERFGRIQGGYYAPDYKPPDSWSAEWDELIPNKLMLFRSWKERSFANGLIFVDIEHSANIEATLAHEWRHHWQTYNQPIKHYQPMNQQVNYRSRIVDFFNHNRHEADALRFELKLAPSNNAREWASWLGWHDITPETIYG